MYMNNFGLSRCRRCNENNLALAPDTIDVVDQFPNVIDGAELLEQVCPVSSLTGNRMSIYEALQMVGSEKYSRALDSLLPEIPAILSDSRLSDDDRVSVLESRLDCGSPSENARMRESLAKIVSDFKTSFEKSATKDTITFDKSDTPNVEANE